MWILNNKEKKDKNLINISNICLYVYDNLLKNQLPFVNFIVYNMTESEVHINGMRIKRKL